MKVVPVKLSDSLTEALDALVKEGIITFDCSKVKKRMDDELKRNWKTCRILLERACS